MVKQFLLLLVIAGLVFTPAVAQDEHPLLKMLALVPDTPEARSWLNYADYRAMEAARGIETPTPADFDNRTELVRVWLAASTGLNTGMRLDNFMQYLVDMPRLNGFAFFDIDQSMTFGQPPSMGTLLNGNFDAESIAAAYSEREFTTAEIDGVTVWCGPDGCENGLQQDLAGREPGDPFGGNLGRKEPIAVLPNGILVNSPHFPIVEGVIATAADPSRSLADAPDYSAVAQALTELGGNVVQVQFINPTDLIVSGIPPAFGGDIEVTPEAQPGELPVYSLAVLADTWQGDEQTAWIGLTYVDVETAQAAADEILTRLETAVSLRTLRSFTETLEASSAEIGEPVIYEGENRVVLLLPFTYPIPPNTPVEGDFGNMLRSSSLFFDFLMSEYFSRSLTFLSLDL